MAAAADDGDEYELLGWNRFFSELMSLLEFCNRKVGSADRQLATYITERLQVAIQSVSAIHDVMASQGSVPVPLVEYAESMEKLVRALRQAILYWEAYLENLDVRMEWMAFRAPRVYSRGRGRPEFHITPDQLEYLRTLNFSWTEVARLLKVSRMTIYRRRRAYGLLGEPSTVPTDAELSMLIRQIRLEMPELGQNLVHGRVRAIGFRVTRDRVRAMMREQDPLNTALRMPGGLTARKKYSVPGPNSLWHVGECTIPTLYHIFNDLLNYRWAS